MKTTRQLERLVRGFSNHRRIEIMELLSKQTELSVAEICDKLKINYKTGAEHVRRLAIAGMIMKRNDNNSVRHALTKEGKAALNFLKTI
ncbi:MAG: Transcriptional regulator, MarR [Parcubacteria group bacterium GW2011_GWB1_49_7]|uniref:HTH arsR-type domain-containing protein n=1 Tax=Candidatus Zambryskibacteria bacterium RIFCSPHIGHO2_01_FULL_46_25 TaxID=1802738 RepID=A0A1G2SZ90_9BACT|nr:MAG: Transcriptional regulator, MarR [Parcubacteria group bacterium GW2011_GWA1_47_10]KKW10013.1 MAG: Transcriptional regulator, MarR [Parcubacteria group bacterium GW2011_GWB1_49_7]OHA90366.1 MAG: hypothetical protein A2838_02075 [Candidatus Zambryskibacteria bacterium RIFCSPHIGHO2_01_FULL_46_25]OHB01480.1 MAG: hypothetical protein A3F53_02115 [Candidatus Zambryskibacteria bacterium RIFCSPHIGHO2_12_FULL_48_10]OHB06903.1 MAG: hypothetical protein A3A31_01210 [Candidatus Zambryskibacteria bac